MKYRRLFTLIPLYSCLMLALPLEAEPKKEPAPPPPVREFDTETLARLGREIYQHDQLAWVATDVVLAEVGMNQLVKEGAQGWVVDISTPEIPLVRFLRKGDAGSEAAYDVKFPKGAEPLMSRPADRALTSSQQAGARTLLTAKESFMKGSLPWCGGNPNTVVLADPDGSGFLVYFLRAKPSTDAIPVGGHYRFTVSADGSKVEQIDQLFASCLTLNRKEAAQGGELVAVTMTHLVSKTPLETHVFLSLQEKLPFVVATMDGVVWSVENGLIQKTDMDLSQNEKKPDAKSKKTKKK